MVVGSSLVGVNNSTSISLWRRMRGTLMGRRSMEINDNKDSEKQ